LLASTTIISDFSHGFNFQLQVRNQSKFGKSPSNAGCHTAFVNQRYTIGSLFTSNATFSHGFRFKIA